MKLGMQVGLGPGHIVLDGDVVLDGNPASPPPNRHSPQFLAHICCDQMAGWIKVSLGMKVDLGPGDFVLYEDPAPSQKGGRAPSSIFGPCPLWSNGWMDQDGTWHRGGPWSRLHCARLEPNSPAQKRRRSPLPIFDPFRLWPNGLMHQDATQYGGRLQPRGVCVRWEVWVPSTLPKRGTEPPPEF